ncbi:hypothetical protein [Streptomyces sp. NPDC020965]|uniref:hypothetical protein n=1 Tax=Streptomyces sp. NPDC020965 TaxID=3365105 RepID=UPI0037991778
MNATEHRPRRAEPDESRLYAVIHWPARIIAVIVVVPLRLLWELLKLIGEGIRILCWTWFLRPILKGLKILLWDWFLRPVLTFVARYLLVPIGNAIAWVVKRLLRPPFVFLMRYLLIKPGALLYRYVLAPVGRYVLAPVAFALIGALWFAGGVSTTVLNFLIVRPLSWLWHAVLLPIWNRLLAPIGRAIRAVLRPIGNATREVLRALRIGGR